MTRSNPSVVDGVLKLLPGPVREFAERFRRGDVLLHAAALAFYALISAVPLVIFILWFVSLFLGDDRVRQLSERAQEVLPKGLGAADGLQRITELGTRLGVVALATGLWPATSYGAGVSRAFHAIAEEEGDLRGLRGRGLLLVALLPLLAFGGLVVAFIATSLSGAGPVGGVAGYVVAFLGGVVGTAVCVAVIYAVFPPRRPRARALVRGATIAAAAASVLSVGYVLFLRFGADFEEHYATSGIAGAVLFGLWLFLSNAAVIVGYTYALED